MSKKKTNQKKVEMISHETETTKEKELSPTSLSSSLDLPEAPEGVSEIEEENDFVVGEKDKSDFISEKEEPKTPEGVVESTEEVIEEEEDGKMTIEQVIGHMATVTDVNKEFVELLKRDMISDVKGTAKALAIRGHIININGLN